MKIVKDIQNYIRRFFSGRMPTGEAVVFNQKSTYIWPTGLGYFMLLVVLLMMIGATNYQNNLAFLLTFLLVGIGLVTIVFTYKNIQGIQFSLVRPDEAFAGQNIVLPVSVKSIAENQHFSIGVGLSKKDLSLIDVPEAQFQTVGIEIYARKRGYLELPRFVATSVFPFGWFRTWGYFGFDRKFIVYPEPKEPSLISKQSSGNEADEGAKREGSDDLYGLRPYQDGEPLTRVDWKSYARERGMFIREFVSYESSDLHFRWDDFVGVDDETRLSYLTFMVLEASSNQFNYGLEIPGASIPFGEGEQHRTRCLEALALYGVKER